MENTKRRMVSLINNAGIWQKMLPAEQVEESVVDDVIATNLTALIHCTRLFLPYIKKQKEAAIINISSKSGVTGQEGQSVYSASKWGVRGFTEVLKTEFKHTNVRVELQLLQRLRRVSARTHVKTSYLVKFRCRSALDFYKTAFINVVKVLK